MLKRTEGMVLKTTPFGEADLIVTYLTYDFGIIKTFAKSPRKIKSRFGSSLEPLTYSKIAFWGKEDANLPRLTQADIILPFNSIRERLNCFLKISEIIELTVNLLPEHEANKKIFALFLDVLKALGKDCNALLTVMMYKIKFLDFAGYAPRLDGCARCGKSGFSFYVSHGAILCGDCAAGADAHVKLSQGSIKLYESLRKWNNSLTGRIKPSGNLFAELSGMLNDHIRYTLSKPLKSMAFRKI